MRILRILRNLMQKFTCWIISDAMNKEKNAWHKWHYWHYEAGKCQKCQKCQSKFLDKDNKTTQFIINRAARLKRLTKIY